MFIKENEKKIAENVRQALENLGLDGASTDIDVIASWIEESRQEIKEDTDLTLSEKEKGLKNINSNAEIILTGWTAYLLSLIEKQYHKDGNLNDLKNSEILSSLSKILNEGYKNLVRPDIDRAIEIFGMLDPLFAAFSLAKKNASLPGMEGARASFCLYQMYLVGEGCNRNLKEAFFALQNASERGLPEANFHLARMYNYGYEAFGIFKNEQNAYEYYKKASMCFAPENQDTMDKETNKAVPAIFTDDGKKLAATGNPVAQYICARSELRKSRFSRSNIRFCAEMARIAAEGDDGNKRRYYRAIRKMNLYSFFEEFLTQVDDAKKIIDDINATPTEKRNARTQLRENFNEFKKNIDPYMSSLTDNEKISDNEKLSIKQIAEYAGFEIQIP